MLDTQESSWNEEQDLLLAENVLRHTRNGSGLLKAFEEVSRNIGKTTNDCAVRWNTALKKQYKRAMEIADKQRQLQPKIVNTTNDIISPIKKEDNSPIKKHSNQKPFSLSTEDMISIEDDMVSYETPSAVEVRQALDTILNHFNNTDIYEKLDTLEKENNELKKYIKDRNEKYAEMEEDYKSLITIMHKATIIANDEYGLNRLKFDNTNERKSI